MTGNWYSNSKPIESIAVADRGAQYGDGLFETIAIREGVPRFWPLHAERLAQGCEQIGLAAPDANELHAELDDAIASSSIDSRRAVAKIVVSAAAGPRGYQRAEAASSVIRIGLFEATPLPPDHYQDGIAARLCSTKLARQPALAGIKSLNRLEQVLARNEWHDPSVFEGLMLDTDDLLICGTMSNVFLCNGNSVLTPAITHCGVRGVMRRQVLAVLTEADQPYEVRDVAVTELLQADEVFISNSQFGVLPVRKIDERRYSPGAITRDVMQLIAQAGVAECAT
jgi:4-amino-4-deoxychorismate lyase